MTAADVLAITSQVDFSTVGVGIGVIAAAIALVLISQKGARMLLGMLR